MSSMGRCPLIAQDMAAAGSLVKPALRLWSTHADGDCGELEEWECGDDVGASVCLAVRVNTTRPVA